MITVAIAGFLGKMGSETKKMVESTSDFQLVALLDPQCTEENVDGVPVFASKEEVAQVKPDVWIDFTTPQLSFMHTKFCLEHKMTPVIGTTGFTPEEIKELQALATEKQMGGLIAPNFSIGAVLMMNFAKQAARYFSDVEILELHHENKLDAPSGTALKTAEMIVENRTNAPKANQEEKELLTGARGANFEGVHIHSVRLPGLVAHQQVQFGATGEGLTIRHDSFDRISFMKGVELGVRKSLESNTLVYGLENYL